MTQMITRLNSLDKTFPVKINAASKPGDYLVSIYSNNGGPAVRQVHVTLETLAGPVTHAAKALNIATAVCAYENRRTQGKAFRGLTGLSIQVLEYGNEENPEPRSYLFHVNPAEASTI